MAQNGGSVTLKVGQQVALALPGSPQSGYQWQVEKVPANLVRKQASSFEPAPKSEVCGMQRLQFAAQHGAWTIDAGLSPHRNLMRPPTTTPCT